MPDLLYGYRPPTAEEDARWYADLARRAEDRARRYDGWGKPERARAERQDADRLRHMADTLLELEGK